MIKVMFFASVREQAGTDCLEIEAAGITNVMELIASLDGKLREALARDNLLVAVNQSMVDPRHSVADGDEVAFFPPVTGG